MIETKHFGRLTATIDHEKRRVTLALAPVRDPALDVAKLERWARQSLVAFQDYEWVGFDKLNRHGRVDKIPLEALPKELPPLPRRFRRQDGTNY